MPDRIQKIRKLNDRLRREHCGGTIIVTRGVYERGSSFIHALDKALADVIFTAGNDPYDEHDFGAVQVSNTTAFFKIDYYDLDNRGASPDPADENVTHRVMTIMLAEEY